MLPVCLTKVENCACVQLGAVQSVSKLFQQASQIQSSILTLTNVWLILSETLYLQLHPVPTNNSCTN
jgi:hypothetical protein